MSKRMLTAADSQNLALRMENRANSRLTEERHSEREDLRLAAAVIRKTAVETPSSSKSPITPSRSGRRKLMSILKDSAL